MEIDRFVNSRGRNVTKQIHDWKSNLLTQGPDLIDQIAIPLAQFPSTSDIPNPTVAGHIRPNLDYSLGDLDSLSKTLDHLGTTHVATHSVSVKVGRKVTRLEVFKASGGDGSDHMNQSYWERDMALAAYNDLTAFRLTGNPFYLNRGQALYNSCVALMTTPDQKRKFQGIIKNKGNPRFINNPANHPAIKFDSVNGVLKGAKGWGHNQDAWQILASGLLDGLEGGELSPTEAMRDFFQPIPQFLDAVDYTNRESKGSWEEISAQGRLSTLAWELPSLIKILKMGPGLNLDINYAQVARLVQQGSEAVLGRFPYESAHLHGPNHPAYRELDATLLYIGLGKTPESLQWAVDNGYVSLDSPSLDQNSLFVRDQPVNLKDWMYETMFKYADKLRDRRLHGFRRYFKDSYQAAGFWPLWSHFMGGENKPGLWTNPVWQDSAGVIHFGARNQSMEAISQYFGLDMDSYEAVWNHPNNQAALIATRLAFSALSNGKSADAKKYGQMAFDYFHDSLAMITGDGEITIAPDENGQPTIVPAKVGIAPECRINSIIKTADGYTTLAHPGPWGPLYWGSSGYVAATESLKSLLKATEKEGYATFRDFLHSAPIRVGVAAD